MPRMRAFFVIDEERKKEAAPEKVSTTSVLACTLRTSTRAMHKMHSCRIRKVLIALKPGGEGTSGLLQVPQTHAAKELNTLYLAEIVEQVVRCETPPASCPA